MYSSIHKSMARVYLALALAAVLCFASTFTPLASVRAADAPVPVTEEKQSSGGEEPAPPEPEYPADGEEPDAGDAEENNEEEGGTDSSVVNEEQPGDEDDLPEGEQPGNNDEELVDTNENEEENDVQEEDAEEAELEEEEPEEDSFPLPEYDPQPTSAEEAFAMWQGAIQDGRQVMWEFPLDEDCVPEGMRQEFVLLDEESGVGFWTLYMDIMAMAMVTRTITSAQALQKAIDDADPGDELVLKLSAGFDMATPIVIDKDLSLTLSAASAPVVMQMAASYVRHFDIRAGNVKLYFENVELNGLVIGNAKGGGINVHNGATVRIENLLLRYTATGSEGSGYIQGGGMYVGGTLELLNSTINSTENFSDGSGIYLASTGKLKISNVQMTFTNATASGGGIYVAPGGELTANYLTISALTQNATGYDPELGGRATTGWGGGIYWNIAAGTQNQSITNSVFNDCVASRGGSAVYISIEPGGTLAAFDNNTINNNVSYDLGTVTIVNEGTVASFTDNTITNNFSLKGAAGIYAAGSSPFAITNTKIENNPGAITISNAIGAKMYNAAGIYSENAHLTIRGGGTSISGNNAAGSPGHGGGIFVAAGTVTFEAGKISNNTAAGSGGGVYVESGTFRQTGGTISGNSAQYGGGVYILAGALAELLGGEISANKATTGGGFGVFNFGNLTLGGTTISGHTGNNKNGAAVMLGLDSTTLMTGGAIKDNTLTNTNNAALMGTGAGIYVNTGASFTMRGGEISGNTAQRGAAIYGYNNTEITIEGGTIRNNTAANATSTANYGGAIYLDENNTLRLDAKSAILIEGNTAAAGGAIYSHENNDVFVGISGGTLTFATNTATAPYSGGGAIFMEEGNLAVSGGTFTGNTSAGDGGAIYLYTGTVTATFTGGQIGVVGKGNTAVGDGGGIFNSAGSLTVKGGTKIEGNSAKGNGGGVSSSFGANDFKGESGNEIVINGNKADEDGGGVYVSNGVLGMEYTNLTYNEAAYGGGAFVAVGGLAMRSGITPFANDDADTIKELDSNIFSNNKASADGGGMYVQVSDGGVSKSIAGNQFLDNEAKGNGGGLYIRYYGEGKRVSDNIVRNNSAGGNGGGLYVEGTMKRYFAITNDVVEDNKAGGHGGGVYVDNTILRMYNTGGTPAKIYRNEAKGNGGGIYAGGHAKIIVEQGNITYNRADGQGGGIYSNVYLADKELLSAENDTLQYAEYLVKVDVASISNNTAKGNGGGIYVGQRGGLTLTGTTLDSNKADTNGGAVYLHTFGVLQIYRADKDTPTKITNNTAISHGGGLYVANGALTMEYAEITGNTAVQGNGGGVFVVLQTDASGTKGGAQKIIYNHFAYNEAQNGGGMHITIKEGATSDVIGTNNMEHNTAEGQGGGAWISFSGTGRSIYMNEVRNNKAMYGGGMYVTGTSQSGNNMSITNDIIENNTADYGGGIMVENSTFVLFDAQSAGYKMLDGTPITGYAEITGNIARNGIGTAGSGGGIYLQNSTLYVQNGTISGNEAHTNGGGIYADGSSLIKTYDPYGTNPTYELRILGNHARNGDGGGMYLIPQRTYELTGLTVQSNTAVEGDGGGIYAPKALLSNLYITNSTFGTPNPNSSEAKYFNIAKADTYVPKFSDSLNSPDAAYVEYHKTRLTGISGHSPDGKNPLGWAKVSDSNSNRLYYNNFDIAFHTAGTNNITVTYHANTGYFGTPSTTIYFDDGTIDDKIQAPNGPLHANASFIGWYDAPYTADKILQSPALTANDDLTWDSTLLWHHKIDQDTHDVDFYAAWLPPPEVKVAYDDDVIIKVVALEGVDSVSLTVNNTISVAGVRSAGDNTLWEFDIRGVTGLENGLAKDMPLHATQTITVAGVSSPVVSPPAANTVLPTYRVVYHINADSETTAEQTRLNSEWKPANASGFRTDADNGETIPVAAPATGVAGRANYDFAGWRQDNSGTLLDPKNNDTITVYDEDIHLYAQWERFYTLTYDANAGTNELDPVLPDEVTKPAGERVPIGSWKKDTEELRTGFRFEYWTGDRAGSDNTHYLDLVDMNAEEVFTTDITLNRDRTLYAKWLPLYQVVYDLNYEGAGECDIKDGEYYAQYEDYFPVSTEVPVRDGYTFMGWHHYQNVAQSPTSGWYEGGKSYLMREQGVTLYAQWEPNLTITYDGNGHTGGTEPTGEASWPYGKTYTVKGPGSLVRADYTFLGWALDETSTTPDYEQGNEYTPTSDTTFYAVWTPTVYPPVVRKDSGETALEPGESFTYTITVFNRSIIGVDAEVTDTLPAGLTYVGSNPAAAQTGQTLVWSKPMDAGELWTITVDVTLDAGYRDFSIRNTATAVFNSDDDLTDEDDDNIFVIQPPTLNPVQPILSKNSGTQVVTPGDDFTYTVSVYNNSLSPVEAAVHDVLPEGVTYRGSSPGTTLDGRTLAWQKTMEPLETWEIEIYVTLDEGFDGSSLYNLATASFNNDDALTSTDDDTTIVLPPPLLPPTVDKASNVDSVRPGESFTYTITIANNSQTAINAVVTDTLPQELAFTGSDTPYRQDGQTLRWQKPMGAGEVWAIVVHVKLDEDFVGSSIHNTAVVTFNGEETLTGSDEDTLAVTEGQKSYTRPGTIRPNTIRPGNAKPGETNSSTGAIVATGDEADMMLWMRMAFIAFAALCVLLAVLCMRKQRRHMKRYSWYYRL